MSKGSCPIKTNLQWTQSVEALGEDNTWKLWIDSPTGDILPPVKGGFYFYIEAKPRQAADLLNKYISLSKKAALTQDNKKSLTEIISAANPDMFQDLGYQSWLEKQEFGEKLMELSGEEEEEETPPLTPLEEAEAVPEGHTFAKPFNFWEIQSQMRSAQILYAYADTASTTRVPFEIVSAEEAKKLLLGNKYVSYSDQAAFSLGNRTYYVIDNINLNTELADIAAPFIARIADAQGSNKDSSYFRSIYMKIWQSPMGASLINETKQLNPDTTTFDSDEFRELVMIQAIKRHSDILKLNSQKQQNVEAVHPIFKEAIDDILAEMKKVLRTKYKGIDRKGINSNTTLADLNKLLEEAGYDVTDKEITNKDLAEHTDAIKQGADDILAAVANDSTKRALDDIIQRFITANNRQLRETNDPVYFEIKQSLSDESGRFLRDIADRLKYLRKENVDVYDNLDDAFKAKALINSLYTLEKTLDKINEFLQDLQNREGKTEQELADTLEKVAHYNYLLQGWDAFITTTKDNLSRSGLDKTSSVFNLLARLSNAVKTGNDTFKAIQRKGAVKSISSLLTSFNAKILADFNDQIAVLQKKPKSFLRDSAINNLEKKKEKYNFTEEKIQKLFRGELGDASFWSSMFESYSTNPDPVIASFALFLKGHTHEILNTATTKSTAYVNKARPYMQSLGMDNVNHKKDWQEFLMIDQKPVRGEDGKITYQSVLAFHAPVKNYRYALAVLDEAIRDAEKSGDKELYKVRIVEKEEHLNKYFNRKYKKAYYDALGELMKENRDAYNALEAIKLELEEFKNANPNEVDFFMHYDDYTTILNKKRQLSNIYREDGSPKPANEKAIAEAIQKHNARTRKFYSSKEKPGAFQRSFESAVEMLSKLPQYDNMVKYDAQGIPTREFREEVINKWLAQNTLQKYSEEYYIRRDKAYELLNEVNKNIPEEYKTDELIAQRRSILQRFQDENGQIDPDLMGDKKDELMAKIKSIQEEINERRERLDDDFFMKNPDLQLQYDEALTELGNLNFRDPSDYYLKIFNDKLIGLGENKTLDSENADSFLTTKNNILTIDALKEKDEAFAKWFDANHIKKIKITSKGKKTYKYERLSAWSISRAKMGQDPDFYVTTTVMLGTEEIAWPGIPSGKFFYTSVKDEFRTIETEKRPGESEEEHRIRVALNKEKAIGIIIDNRGQYLPLSDEQFKEQGRLDEYNDPKNDLKKYRNNDYYTLIQNSDKKALLELTKQYHLGNQLGIDRDQKLYLDLPRYPIRTILEGVQSGQIYSRWVDRIKSITSGIRATLSGKSQEEANLASQQDTDLVDEFSNPDVEKDYEQIQMLQEGLLNPALDKIGIKGIQNLDMEKVSYDVIAAVNVYMLQTEKQKVYNKISPIAQAIANTLEDTDAGIAQLNNIKEKAFSLGDTAKHLLLEDGKSIRASAFRAFMQREFKGQQTSERHLDWLNKLTAAITGGAAMNYFALNLPSAIKNYWGILWQMNIEAIAGEYFDFISMGKGKVDSKIAMHEWSTRVWGGTYNTLFTQMIMRFDPTQGKAEEALGSNFSRTFTKDLASVSWVYSPRKYMEMEGGLQLFFSMMHHVKIQMADGGKIDYAEAWELDKQGRMVLKAGADPSYGITYAEDGTTILGENFKKFQNRVHEKFKDLNGTFAKYEQPQAQLFFSYRLFAFMRRYFTSMFMNRFGIERANHALETVRTGYYIEAVKSVAKMLTSFGQHAAQLAPSERRALLKASIDIIQIFAISAIAALLFGYDDDDDDKLPKLKAKSGALGEDDFRLDGWLSNHALLLLLKTQQENQSFIPLPGFGLNNYLDFTSSTSIAFGPTITSGAKLLNLLAKHALPGDDEDLYYTRDMGPYPWQKEGEAKIWTTLGNMGGFSGSQTSPVKGLALNEMYNSRQ